MKRTITMWAVFMPTDIIIRNSVGYFRCLAIRDASKWAGTPWKELKIKGYRCRKVTISWEE